MIPSSSSNLSVKSQPNRPPSSLLSRPSSRNTLRPSSSLGNRPLSSASTRPGSRFSQRPNSRQARSRLIPLAQTLVNQVTGLEVKENGGEGVADADDDDDFREAVEYVVRSLETSTINKASASVDMSVIDRQISGLALKARINSQDAFGEALQLAYKRIKANIEEREMDLDQDIKSSRLPDHLQFLLTLGKPPSQVTLDRAEVYLQGIKNPPPPPPTLTWKDILAEEPFEGEHWEGVYGLPAGAVRSMSKQDRADREEWDSTPSLSPLNSDDLALDDEDDSFSSADYERYTEPESSRPSSPEPVVPHDNAPRIPLYEQRKQFEELRARQYWRDDWHTDADVNAPFSIGDPSTLGPTLSKVLARASGSQDAHSMLQPEHYIDEADMVREILMALQGNNNTIIEWNDNAFRMTPKTPRLVHLTLASQESIITSLGNTATTVHNLRRFAAAVFARSISGKQIATRKATATRTCEAFADAIDEVVRRFDSWCSAKEEAICTAYIGMDEEPLIVSLLGTEREIRDQYEATFDVLLEVVRMVFQIQPGADFSLFDQRTQTRQPATLTAFLLDTLFSNVQQHMERRDAVTSDKLMRVFIRTAEPVWGMVGRWLKDGMGLGLGVGTSGRVDMADELDEEFFIESSGVGVGMMGLGLLDPEFWKEGYALREGAVFHGELGPVDNEQGQITSGRKAIPSFLEHVAELVLSTGKAVGLMRALGGPLFSNVFNDWKTFADLVGSENHNQSDKDGVTEGHGGLFAVSVDTLSRLIYDGLLPHCESTASSLVKVLVDDCAVWKHLESIEDLFLMRRGDAMSHFIDTLFAKMDSTQPWSDFHFLNTAFNDVIDANRNAGVPEWVNASLVRFAYRGNKEKDRAIKRTVKAIDGLIVEYAVPFPLTYIFQPATIQGYSDIFVFLLQIRRAKSVLERILVRDDQGRGKKLREELKVFHAMRSRLSWFINTLLNFLTTYVIHAEVSRFREAFRKTKSLDEMIQLHDEHLEKIRGRCLLKPNTSALQRAILSILDMCLHFSEGFVAFAGDNTATLDVSRQSVIMKRHRSRRQRRQKRNVIGFSQYLQDEDDSSSDEDMEGAEHINDPPEPSFSMAGTSVTTEDDFYAGVERMSSELDGLVRFLRRGVESLAGGSGEAAPAFGVLAFSLEDWDM
ncbi:Gamma-tubulin complex component 5 [Psilocybe cubensis]|uniref:Spindle pole body component n=2 Tax=Psilocybe cubensis TaxID=181762 RepID=A0A8H7Y0C1_PSICU|nr:Gamma-tubulin complex component 5 [Psilocybe cubensis]KAH9482299.1 Gamma-tubulin complex component 5 [Psilocybe cubensis]